jgi:hypothetical protein
MIGIFFSYLAMKCVISQTARIVSFFNSSHYWGGQLENAVQLMDIHYSMKTLSLTGIH